MMEQFIIATNNQHKLREFRQILSTFGIEIRSQKEAGCTFEVEETGDTFEENAYLKASAVTRATGRPAIADDSGLMVDCLGGEPGVYSARYCGDHDASDQEKCNYLLMKIGDAQDRTAKFVCCICCTFPNGDILRARGECPGTILRASRGENGFGYDPIFCPVGMEASMAELTEDEKNAISHRGNALKQFKQKLEEYYATH
jgi:XTP/dITP diphosphohydrolase